MPYSPTPNLGLTGPELTDPANVPADLEELRQQIDAEVAPRDSHNFPGALSTDSTFEADGVATLNAGAISPARTKTVSSGTYTLLASDASKYLRFTVACVVTIPPSITPLGTEVNLVNASSGTLQVQAGALAGGVRPDVEGLDGNGTSGSGRLKITHRNAPGTLIYDVYTAGSPIVEHWSFVGGATV
jgi:hypothetical protein